MKNTLTIAGSDSCGGAGIQADLKTISAMGVYGMSVVTAITAQNTMGVFSVQEIQKELIEEQMKCLFNDIEIHSVKIGMLSSSEIIQIVEKNLIKYGAKNIVIDPVMVSKSNYKLLKDDAIDALREFITIGDLITPNIKEAEMLCNMKIKNENDMIKSAHIIQNLGVKNILIKGGHMRNSCTDILLLESGEIVQFEGERIHTNNTHGTGCTLSSSIAALLAKEHNLKESIRLAKTYITQAIKDSFALGHGVGAIGHFVELYRKAGIKY